MDNETFRNVLARLAAGCIAAAGAMATQPAGGAESPSAIAALHPGSDGYVDLGFDRLASFDYVTPDEAAQANDETVLKKDQIPGQIHELNHARVALRGFMMPITMVGGVATEFLIMANQSACCYGLVPKMNQWVEVRVSKGVAPIMDRVVTMYGTLKVGEVRESGYLVSIYQMDGERMVGPAN